ncbi:4553_t:CDS:2 [Cetraspora pellucida]|uniref:4553_t:CDS:1 n=1 Tax=Cetraspora pellucida TaxID=1433469 RepID=A0A9N9H7M2_9GLOM|nr:4553_t:CDS:2 [Cetraspora pellucida]
MMDLTFLDNFLKLHSPNKTLKKFKNYLETQEDKKASDLSRKDESTSTDKESEDNIQISEEYQDVYDEFTLFKHALNENVNYINENLDEKLANYILDYQKIKEIYEDDQLRRWYYLSLLKVYQLSLVDKGIGKHWHMIYIKDKASKKQMKLSR